MLLGGSEMLVVRYGGFQRGYVFERENNLGLCRGRVREFGTHFNIRMITLYFGLVYYLFFCVSARSQGYGVY